MQIRVKCGCAESCPEWAIVELQGVIEAQPAFANRLQDLQIGVLCRPSAQEIYTFTVGYHELTGNKVPLKKPMLILKKRKLDEDTDINTPGVELDVIGIIRQKVLFKTRPRALISRCKRQLVRLLKSQDQEFNIFFRTRDLIGDQLLPFLFLPCSILFYNCKFVHHTTDARYQELCIQIMAVALGKTYSYW
ncbi:hypothetical protein DM860_010082 [Cuscuta australis]|uniref:Chromosome transmission fidelity protein 8 n=1 Tax=Cuscuta australis TaxID=267555 RepID=A0A328DA17_9ASTE|nr:hypothetical protein DM860_010082 [Cuscuta australis]